MSENFEQIYNVVCMKWGKKYDCEYVNKLYRMCLRNTTVKFRFICYTDDASGIDERVEIKSLPEMNLPSGPERGWLKLSMFKRDLDIPQARTLFLDLDTVIVGNIDEYFTVDGDLVLVKHRRPSKKQGIGMTSVFRFEPHTHPEVYENFVSNIDKVKASYRHEQAYLCGFSSERGFLSLFPAIWNPSFKHNCMRFFLMGLFFEPILPEGAKMIIFHGNPTPAMAMRGEIKGWRKFVRFLKTPKWLIDNWC